MKNDIYIGNKDTSQITIHTTDPAIKRRILSYSNRPGVKILSKKGDHTFEAMIPVSFIRVIEPKKPWENILGCLDESVMPDFDRIEEKLGG